MKKVNDDCIFCKISNGQIPSVTVYENRDFRVIMDISPATKGHMLVIPKEHFDNIYELDSDTASKLFVLVSELARVIKKELQCDGLNIVQNNEEVAGQTVNHLHVHLIPRYKEDGVDIHWKQLESDQDKLKEIAEKIKNSL